MKLNIIVGLITFSLFPSNLMGQESDLSNLDGTNGFVITGFGSRNESSVHSTSGAGDVNGDGIDDIIIGARYVDSNGHVDAGASYVVFGQTNNFVSPIELSGLNGTNGFVINGLSNNDFTGAYVSTGGDINGDGVDDIIIGAIDAPSAASYVVFGNTNGFTTPLNLSDLDGTNGFTINGVNRGLSPVSYAGDINNDGIDDIIIGMSQASPNDISTGSSYVVFGSNNDFPNPLELSNIDGSNGFVMNGVSMFDETGRTVSGAGDVNGDGIDDVIIGARGVATNGPLTGANYVVFGNASLPHPLELSSLDGNNGIIITGLTSFDILGHTAPSGAGDLNGDGIDDLIMAADLGDPVSSTREGVTYVVFGDDLIFSTGFE